MAAESAIIPQLAESITPSSPAATCSGPMAGGDTSSNAHTSIPCQQDILLDEQTKKELFTDTFCKVCNAVLQFESHRISHYEGKKHAQKVRLYFLKNELEEIALKTQRTDHRVEFHVDGEVTLDKNKFCGLCNMVFSSPVVAQTHYVGKIHAKKMRQSVGEQVEWTPQTDQDFTATSPVDSHTETAGSPAVEPTSDKRSEQEVSAEQQLQSCNDNEIDLNDPNKYCKLCCASFNKALVAQQHYSGKKHARNEARKKMMEEMEQTDSGVSEGKYVCPICSITLTSIEMYQSHMQGNKHQIKEHMVANLMKTSKKNYDSFQDELAEYIKVQKARGLEPKTQFRPEKDQYDSGDYEEEEEEPESRPLHGHINSKANAPYKYLDRHPVPYPVHNSSHPADHRVPAWGAHWEKGSRPPRGPHFDLHKTKHISRSPSSQDSSSDSSGSSTDESSGSYKKDKRRKRKHHRESRLRGSGRIRKGDENSKKRKRKNEDADSAKEDKQDKGKSSGGDKDKHRKEKKKREEQSKKQKKPKKEGEQRTEEEMLWDESILGF